jgi:U4/U6 small nuclear ribonucleoprotein PRP4
MKSIVVPVLDVDVRKVLRRLQEPITLFGEREMERRERLRKLLATMTDEQAQALAAAALEEQQVPEFVMRPKELFYTEGTETLRTSRLKIALFSLERASQRIAAEKRRQERILSDAAEAAMAVKSDELLGEGGCVHVYRIAGLVMFQCF